MGPDNPTAVEQTQKLLERITRTIENQKKLNIYNNYHNALFTYFEGLNYANAFMLTNPLLYFFVKNGQLRCFNSFSYKNGKSPLLSPQTIPSFLRFYFGLEGRRTPERDAFFTALRDYIDCFYQTVFFQSCPLPRPQKSHRVPLSLPKFRSLSFRPRPLPSGDLLSGNGFLLRAGI